MKGRYFLYKNNDYVREFPSRRAFCSFMQALPDSAVDIARDYTLVVSCPDLSQAFYSFRAYGFKRSHLRAVKVSY